jgi:predicted transcriptional regulator
MNKVVLVVGGFVVGYITHREIMKLAVKDMLDKEYPKKPYSNYRDILLTNKEDAMSVLGDLKDLLDEYGVVTVSDVFNVAGVVTSTFTDTKYGWTSLLGAYIRPNKDVDKDGYRLVLPEPRLLD